MILDFIKNNIKIAISFTWVIFAISSLIVLSKTTKKNIKAENKSLHSIILLLLGSIAIVIYNNTYGYNLLAKIIKDLGITNIWFTILVSIIIYLIIKTFSMNLKIQALKSMMEKIDQRYSINENHSEYQKRKNNQRNYRSQ